MSSTDGIGDYDAWKRDAVDIKMADGLIVWSERIVVAERCGTAVRICSPSTAGAGSSMRTVRSAGRPATSRRPRITRRSNDSWTGFGD